jgi:hypothetical protein
MMISARGRGAAARPRGITVWLPDRTGVLAPVSPDALGPDALGSDVLGSDVLDPAARDDGPPILEVAS